MLSGTVTRYSGILTTVGGTFTIHALIPYLLFWAEPLPQLVEPLPYIDHRHHSCRIAITLGGTVTIYSGTFIIVSGTVTIHALPGACQGLPLQGCQTMTYFPALFNVYTLVGQLAQLRSRVKPDDSFSLNPWLKNASWQFFLRLKKNDGQSPIFSFL